MDVVLIIWSFVGLVVCVIFVIWLGIWLVVLLVVVLFSVCIMVGFDFK